MNIKRQTILLLLLILLLISCNLRSDKQCCQFIPEGLAYDLQCRNLNSKECIAIGKIVRIDAPPYLSFSKYQKLSTPEPDTIYQTITEGGMSSTTMDQVIQRELKSDYFFTYALSSVEMANNINIIMEESHIYIIYRDKIKQVSYSNITQEEIERIMQSLEGK